MKAAATRHVEIDEGQIWVNGARLQEMKGLHAVNGADDGPNIGVGAQRPLDQVGVGVVVLHHEHAEARLSWAPVVAGAPITRAFWLSSAHLWRPAPGDDRPSPGERIVTQGSPRPTGRP